MVEREVADYLNIHYSVINKRIKGHYAKNKN